MKIYSLPDEVPAPTVNYTKYDRTKIAADEAKHTADLKAFLKKVGYTGKRTGEIYREGVADGYALYMVADGRKFGLVHLPYGDGYHARDVGFLTKKEILHRLEFDNRLNKLFAKKA